MKRVEIVQLLPLWFFYLPSILHSELVLLKYKEVFLRDNNTAGLGITQLNKNIEKAASISQTNTSK